MVCTVTNGDFSDSLREFWGDKHTFTLTNSPGDFGDYIVTTDI